MGKDTFVLRFGDKMSYNDRHIDTLIYIWYDTNEKIFNVFGKRGLIDHSFYFNCKTKKGVAKLLKMLYVDFFSLESRLCV